MAAGLRMSLLHVCECRRACPVVDTTILRFVPRPASFHPTSSRRHEVRTFEGMSLETKAAYQSPELWPDAGLNLRHANSVSGGGGALELKGNASPLAHSSDEPVSSGRGDGGGATAASALLVSAVAPSASPTSSWAAATGALAHGHQSSSHRHHHSARPKPVRMPFDPTKVTDAQRSLWASKINIKRLDD